MLNRDLLIRRPAQVEVSPSQHMSRLKGPIQQIGSDGSMSTLILTDRIQEDTGTADTTTTIITGDERPPRGQSFCFRMSPLYFDAGEAQGRLVAIH